jgi:hypothetical protein
VHGELVHSNPVGDPPDLNLTVEIRQLAAAGGQPLPIGRKRQLSHTVGIAGDERAKELAVRRLNDADTDISTTKAASYAATSIRYAGTRCD